jgi:hypothetical protein
LIGAPGNVLFVPMNGHGSQWEMARRATRGTERAFYAAAQGGQAKARAKTARCSLRAHLSGPTLHNLYFCVVQSTAFAPNVHRISTFTPQCPRCPGCPRCSGNRSLCLVCRRARMLLREIARAVERPHRGPLGHPGHPVGTVS